MKLITIILFKREVKSALAGFHVGPILGLN